MKAGKGHLYLRLTGDEAAKRLLREKLGLLYPSSDSDP
jgi:hypothetical protein